MSVMPGSAQSELYAGLLPVEPSDEPPPLRPTILDNDLPLNRRPPLRKRASRTLLRFLITFCLGIAGTLTWQSYGDACRELIVSSYPQLGWLAPQAKPADTIALASPPTPSFDPQQLNAMSQDLEAVTQSIDRIATSLAAGQEEMRQNIDRIASGISSSQEQMMHTIDQLAAGQERVALEITKLQAVEQYILYKNSEPLPSTDPAPAPKRIPWPSQASTAR
jgi:hypothetical protein